MNCPICGARYEWSGGEPDEERYEPNCDCEIADDEFVVEYLEKLGVRCA